MKTSFKIILIGAVIVGYCLFVRSIAFLPVWARATSDIKTENKVDYDLVCEFISLKSSEPLIAMVPTIRCENQETICYSTMAGPMNLSCIKK